jgi:hypothetical protein
MIAAAEIDQPTAIQNGHRLAAQYTELSEFITHLIPYGRIFSDRHQSSISKEDDQKLSYFVNICYNASPAAAALEHIHMRGIRPLPFAFRQKGVPVRDEVLQDLSTIPEIIDRIISIITDQQAKKIAEYPKLENDVEFKDSQALELKHWQVLKDKAAILVASADFQAFARDSLAKIDRPPGRF